MRRFRQAAALALILPSIGCAGDSHPVPVNRQPDATLLLPCELTPAPPARRLSDNEKSALMIALGEALLRCARQHSDLVVFVKEGKPDPAAPATSRRWLELFAPRRSTPTS
jgi:hypothetical protein